MQPSTPYIHYAGPPSSANNNQNVGINPGLTNHSNSLAHAGVVTTNVQHRQQPAVAGSSSSTGILHLAPTARANAAASGNAPSNQSSTSVLNMNANAKRRMSTTASAVAVPQANSSGSPIVASGDWTKGLIHLARTAELKKHALTLQLHTAHILSGYAALDEKRRGIQDVKEQQNKLESERARLLICLREVNEDRDKADIAHATLTKETTTLQNKIESLTQGEYAASKADVDRLRAELGQPTLPGLQATLDERAGKYLTDRRLGNTTEVSSSSPNNHANSNNNNNTVAPTLPASSAPKQRTSRTSMNARRTSTTPVASTTDTTTGTKRTAGDARLDTMNSNGSSMGIMGFDNDAGGAEGSASAKKPRGRPKGSKNRKNS